MPRQPDTRTVADVLEQQKHAAAGGCCDRFADMSACSCLQDAQERDVPPPPRRRQQDDLGPLPQVHPRHQQVAKAENEFGSWVMTWRDRHGLTLSEALAIVSRELTRSLDQCVRSERKSS